MDFVATESASIGIVQIILMLLYLVFAGLGLYCLILLIRLGHRGIKALDIYINANKNKQ